MIPPLLGFYAKLFVIAALADTTHFYLAIFTILCSVVGCVRYLNIIQISNMKMNGLIGSANYKAGSKKRVKAHIKSYIIAVGTGVIALSFLNPIYLISSMSWPLKGWK